MTALEPPNPDRQFVRDRDIQIEWINGARQVDIAARYNMAQPGVSVVVNRATGSLGEQVKEARRQGRGITMDEFERADMRRVYRQGFHTYATIAKMYDVSYATAYHIINLEDE